MNFKRLILFAFLLSTRLTNAQTDFRPGYIIKIPNDTIYGEIDSRGDLLMSKICKFKDTEKILYKYLPKDILAYRFMDSKYYISKIIKGKGVFLEYLIKGKVNIYYMRDDNGDHYFIEKENMELIELPYKEKYKFIGDKEVFYKSKKHIGFLNLYMQDADNLKKRIERIEKPEHQSLIKLAEDYHNIVCKDEQCIVYEKKFPFIKLSVEPFFGLTKHNGTNQFINEFGGNIYFWAPRSNEKLYVKTGLAYHKVLEDGESKDRYKIPLQIQYLYPAFKFRPKVSYGINVLSFEYDDYRDIGYTMSLNAGFNYYVYKSINLSVSFNSDYTPINYAVMFEELGFNIISYSINFGLYIEL